MGVLAIACILSTHVTLVKDVGLNNLAKGGRVKDSKESSVKEGSCACKQAWNPMLTYVPSFHHMKTRR